MLAINSNINTSKNLTLTAGAGAGSGAINFDSTKEIAINGRTIILNADAAPRASGRNISVIATADIALGASLNAGSGRLTITAGDDAGTGKIDLIGTNAISLRGGVVRLASDDAPTAAGSRTNEAALTIAASTGIAAIECADHDDGQSDDYGDE